MLKTSWLKLSKNDNRFFCLSLKTILAIACKMQRQFDNRLRTSPQPESTPAKGYAGYWSMNVNGDLRALYVKQGATNYHYLHGSYWHA